MAFLQSLHEGEDSEDILEDIEIVVKPMVNYEEKQTAAETILSVAEAIPCKLQPEEGSNKRGSTGAGLEWRKYLSGALSDEQLYLAMFVLFIFYFVYTLYNAFLDNSQKDEGDVIRNCTCKDSHRKFYLFWSITCFTLWFVCHSLYTLAKSFPRATKSLKQKCINQIRNSVGKYVQICGNDDKNDSNNNDDSDERKLKKVADQHIDHCEMFLWSQSYEMYAVGMKKRNEQLNLKEVEKLIARSLSLEIRRKECLSVRENNDKGSQDLTYNFHIVKSISLALFHLFIAVVRFIAQLSVVPLLIIQMFDTYTLLCLAERDYCNRTSRYRLHLDQTALSFSFYCSLMISLLTTTWLNLVPFPKLELCNCVPYHATSKVMDRRSK